MPLNPQFISPNIPASADNKDISRQQILQRVFDRESDSWRITLVDGSNITIDISDVQIGAVEIKDETTDDRVNVVACKSKNALLVQDCLSAQKIASVNLFVQSNVGAGLTATLSSFTVPVGEEFFFFLAKVGGNGSGKFSLEIGAVVKDFARNSGSQRTVRMGEGETIVATAGQVVNIKVTNIHNQTKQFESRLSGFTIIA